MTISRTRLQSATVEVCEAITPMVEKLFGKRVGFTIILSTFGDGGSMAYASTVVREDMIKSLREMLAYLESGLATEPTGDRDRGTS